ncbi:chloroplastic import inner membrane translocase subunit HP30-2 [Lactuca sativa]|uniref:chloroplastic import inner membrane translocase subunit HP30-2 n=1 Tax=Lactuca sativa TaxID=4236 RepID=UPI000CD86C68|nr:chloroplastic import inner membrane translocase subunit HP30-2 [Lactuca sativa]
MGEEKKGFLVIGHQNPLKHVETKYNECETLFNTWLAKQSLPVEAAIVTVTSALQGAAIGGLTSLPNDVSSSFSPPPPTTSLTLQTKASFQQSQAVAGWPLAQARNLAVTCGVNAGISCVLRRLRGKEDVQSNMAAGFGSGVMFSLVSGIGGSNQAATAITSGVLFALAQGGFFKIREKISMPNPEDVLYNETRSMLTSLGLGHYEKNFKKGLLTDNTLPLLTDSALQDARIPPGPRLLILDHIERENEVKKTSGFPYKW